MLSTFSHLWHPKTHLQPQPQDLSRLRAPRVPRPKGLLETGCLHTW